MDYRGWLSHESKWMKGYRRKAMRQMKYRTTPIVALALGFIMVIRNFGRPMEIMVEYFIGGVIGGLVLMGFALLFMSIGLSGRRVTTGIEAAVKAIGLTEPEKDALARELYDAETRQASCLSFSMNGPAAKGTPAEVVVSRHYAMMKGGSPLVVIVRLDAAERIEKGEEKKSVTEYGGKTRTTTFFTLYTIRFEGKSGLLGGFGFFEAALRDQVYAMIEQQR